MAEEGTIMNMKGVNFFGFHVEYFCANGPLVDQCGVTRLFQYNHISYEIETGPRTVILVCVRMTRENWSDQCQRVPSLVSIVVST